MNWNSAARSDSRAAHRSSSGISRMRDQNAGSSYWSRHAGAQVPLEQPRQVARHPRRHVHAVGDRAARPFFARRLAPQRREHLSRHLAVQLADGVDRARRSHRERRHVELRARCRSRSARAPETARRGRSSIPSMLGELLLDQVERERVVAGRHRRVRREDRRPPDFGERVVPVGARREEIAHALQDDERGVAFVEVPDRG